MLCLKKVYRDELLQLALLLSILRVNNDSFYDNIYNNLDFDNGTSWRSITPAFLRSQYVSPKSLDSVLLNYQRDLFADLNSLGRFNGGNFRHPDVTTYLLNIDRTAPTSNADSLPVANAPGSQNQSESTVNEEEANSLDFGISLSQEDMDLIEVLWKQDVDLGFTVDNIKPEKEDIKTEPDEKVTPASAADKDDIEKLKTLQAINDDSIKQEKEEDPWSGFNYTIDTETGEYVIKTEVDSENSGEEVSNPVGLGLEDFSLPLPEFFLDEALRLIDLEDETSQENTINLKELDSLQSEAGSPSAASAAVEVKAASKTDDISPSEEALQKDDQDDEFDFLNMIQTPQFHHPHHRAPFQSRMPFVRTMSMEQRWQDLASLLSLPSHENGGIHHPFSHHHHALHNYTHHPHPHSMGYSPEAARGVLLHNATLPTPIGDLNSSVPYNNLARKHPTYGVWASSLHKVYDYNLPRWPDGGSEDEDCNGGTNFGSAVASSMNLTNSSEPMGDSSSTPHYKLEPSHDMVYYQNGSSEINQTDGFLSSILNDEDLQLMDMAMNEGMYTMRMLDGNSTVNNIASNNTNITMSRNDMERMDTSSDSAVSSMGSERVPSLSDGEWGDGGSDSGHTSTEHYVTDYTTKLRPYDYSYSNRQLNNGIGGNDNARIQPVAQKKHQMYGKRFFQDHNSSNSSQSPATPLKYEYREPASSYNISNQSEGAVGPKVPEMKYSCSMEFGHLNRNPVNHIQHNHTYHLPAESSGVMQRPVLRDKSKQKKIEDEHLTRDEKRARALNVPISVDDIINLPMDEYNERLSKYDLSEAQLSLIRDIRRRGKNKVAAQNCRKRKLDQILSLADEVKEMKDRKLRLITDHEYIKNECRRYRDKYQQLYRHVFQNLRDPDGNQYSPYQWSLQTSADGSIILVPRSNSSVSSQDPKDPLQNHKEP